MHIIQLNKDKSFYNDLYLLTSVEVIRFFIVGLSLNLPGIILLLGDPRRPSEAYPCTEQAAPPAPTAVDNRAATTEQARGTADPGPGRPRPPERPVQH